MLSATTACHFQFFVNNAWVVQDTSGAGNGQRWLCGMVKSAIYIRYVPGPQKKTIHPGYFITFAVVMDQDDPPVYLPTSNLVTYCGLLNVCFHSFEIYKFAKISDFPFCLKCNCLE